MLKVKLKYLGHLMKRAKSGKDPCTREDWRQKEKEVAEDEMIR